MFPETIYDVFLSNYQLKIKPAAYFSNMIFLKGKLGWADIGSAAGLQVMRPWAQYVWRPSLSCISPSDE